jgi:L-2-hydroxyglutarate oxidase LhgO
MFNTQNYKDVPEHVLDTLIAWGKREIPYLSHTYEALLSSDLFGFMNRADDEMIQALPQIVKFIANELPIGCYGSLHNLVIWHDLVPTPDTNKS